MKALLADDQQTADYLKAELAYSKSRSTSTTASSESSVIDWKRERQPVAAPGEEVSAVREREDALVPVSLLAATIAYICQSTSEGAILAFLPGIEEILATHRLLIGQRLFGLAFSDESKFQICFLHSTVPKIEQDKVFVASPPGCRKVILSTNIAETSVTVADVKYVIDTGKLREKRYDQLRRITKLQCVWQSKSNSKQRQGRAGRVQDGSYYALFSKERSETLLATGLPELLRSDPQEACLSIKAQKFDEPIATFLSRAIEPPSDASVNSAIQTLTSIEALTANEDLTPLGRVLLKLPITPALGKIIILGIVFRCLDPMIVIGAASEERPLFVVPTESRDQARKAHHSYAADSGSDQIGLLNAFHELRSLRKDGGGSAAYQRSRENFLHFGAFESINNSARHTVEVLEDSKLIQCSSTRSSEFGPAALNRNSSNSDLIKCLLAAGNHPNLAVKSRSYGISYRTPSEQDVKIHPGSVNSEVKKDSKRHALGTLFTFGTLAKSIDGGSLNLQNSTAVTPLMAMLFGGKLRITEMGGLEMDEWLPFAVKYFDRDFATKLVLEFRKALDRLLNGTFHSIAKVGGSYGSDTSFAGDAITDRFADRIVEILDQASGRPRDSAIRAFPA